jgi:hypothetical protein
MFPDTTFDKLATYLSKIYGEHDLTVYNRVIFKSDTPKQAKSAAGTTTCACSKLT